MFRKLTLLIVSVTFFISTAVFAVGLGKSELHSGLNQPLKAEIKLLSVEDLAEHELKVSLATNDEFEKVGVDNLFFLKEIKFKTLRDKNGDLYIGISSQQPIKEPFLNFVVALNYPKGRFVKEFTFLLDPPVFDKTTASTIQQASTTSSSRPAKITKQVNTQPAKSRPNQSQPSYNGSTYGAVNSTDTLWSIANKTRPNNSVSIHQTLVAIYQANPQAFGGGNINNLLRGEVLQIPSAETISQVPHRAALQDVVLQNRQWQSGGARRIVDNGKQAKATEKYNANARLSLATQNDDSENPNSDTGSLSKAKNDLVRSQEKSATLQAENNELRARLADLLNKIESSGKDAAVNLSDTELAALVQQSKDNSAAKDDDSSNQDNTSLDSNADLAQQDNEIDLVDEMNDSESVLDDSQQQNLAEEELTEQGSAGNEMEQAAVDDVVVTTPAKATPKLITPVPEKGFFEQIMDSSWLVGGIIGLLVLIALAVFWRMRQRMEEDDFQDDLVASAGSGSMDPTETFELPDVGDDMLDELERDDEDVSSSSTDESFDPIGEADIYIAYGKFEQAENLLTEAIEDNPIRSDLKVKLMECYAESENKDKFEALADEVSTGADAQEWLEQINTMRDQAWSNDSSQDDEFDLPSTEDIFGDESNDFESNLDSLETTGTIDKATDLNEQDFSLDEDMLDDSGFSLDDEPESDEEFELDMEMDLGVDDEPHPVVSPEDAVTETFDSIDDDDFSLDDSDDLDINLDDSDGMSLDDDFDFDDEDSELSDGDNDDVEDEISTKLDLARAYIDMGDSDGAKEILSEVISDGNAAQQAEAKALIDKAD